MKKIYSLLLFFLVSITPAIAQFGWTICNTPFFKSRVDDIYMVNSQVGYAVCGDGQIVKSIDGGNNWLTLLQDTSIYCRSVEFINEKKGFVGGFHRKSDVNFNTLRRTLDGGATWTDLTLLLDSAARKGICGLAVADSNTIYGCGNYFQDSAYIVKSTDGGDTWSFIDMHNYATSLIDMYFLNKDTGFATGRGLLPMETAVILYTTDGGQNWTYKFQNTIASEYCWKIYRLTDKIYYGGIEDLTIIPSRIVKSTDGGMTWTVHMVDTICQYTEGIGFLDSLKGWVGGWGAASFETNDGGITWTQANVCPWLNRLHKVNDSLLFASGNNIWKYSYVTGTTPVIGEIVPYATLNCHPNPVNEILTIDVALTQSTHVMVLLFDSKGNRIKVLDNSDRYKGTFNYKLNTNDLPAGIYFVVLKTHEDKHISRIVVTH